MKKLLFIGIILAPLFLFIPNVKANTPPPPENELVINKTIRQCAVTKFNSKLPWGWERSGICYGRAGCPETAEYFYFLKKELLPLIKEVCDNGYLDIRYDSDSNYTRETYFKEPIDYNATETLFMTTSKYAIGGAPMAINTDTGECNIAINESARRQDIIPKIVFRVGKGDEDRVENYFSSKEFEEKTYKAFCKATGYMFIGNLKNYQLVKIFVLFGGIIIIIVGTIIFIRKRRANKK